MSRTVNKLPKAKRDLADLAFYLGQQRSGLGERFLAAAERSFDLLASMPELGCLWESDNPKCSDLRWWLVKGFRNHLILYRPTPGGIEVVRVIYASRDIEGILASEPP